MTMTKSKFLKLLCEKNAKLHPMPPSMQPEALLITQDLTDSASDGMDGGTGCNFIFLLSELRIKLSL